MLTDQNKLSILTWNVAFLPSLNAKKKYKSRVEEIAILLNKSNADVIALQEVFPKNVRKQLINQLSKLYPHYITTNKKGNILVQNSGLIIFSKSPIEHISELKFHIKTGYDKLAKKGAVIIKGEINSQPFYIVSTHMQSFPGQKNHEIRLLQLKQIRKLLDKVNPENEIPIIMVGDFNVNRHRIKEHREMLKVIKLRDATGSLASENSFVGFNNNWTNKRYFFFDYILNNNLIELEDIKFLKFGSKNIEPTNLSDHRPMMAIYNF